MTRREYKGHDEWHRATCAGRDTGAPSAPHSQHDEGDMMEGGDDGTSSSHPQHRPLVAVFQTWHNGRQLHILMELRGTWEGGRGEDELYVGSTREISEAASAVASRQGGLLRVGGAIGALTSSYLSRCL